MHSADIWHFHDDNPGDTNSGRALSRALGGRVREINTARFVEADRLIEAFRHLPPPPYPPVALCTSNAIGIFFLRALKIKDARTVCVPVGYMPVGAAACFDLMPFFPVHNYPPHDRAMKTTGVLTPVNTSALERWRSSADSELLALPCPKVGVFIGTRSRHCSYPPSYFMGLVRKLEEIEKNTGCIFLLCTNRRISAEQLACLRAHFPAPRHRIFAYSEMRFEVENPYWAFLACASAFVVTSDSLSMISDAMATHRPVFVAGLSEALGGKWKTFFQDLLSAGWIADLFHSPFHLQPREGQPLDEAKRVAERIREISAVRFAEATQ